MSSIKTCCFHDEKQKETCLSTIKTLNDLERSFRTEVMDPELRLSKLKDLWQHSEFMVGWAAKEVVGQRLKEIIDYQVGQISAMIIINPKAEAEERLAMINTIFEIVSKVSRSAHGQVREQEDLKNRLNADFEQYMRIQYPELFDKAEEKASQ